MAVTLLKPATMLASCSSLSPHLAHVPSRLTAQQEFPSTAMEATLLNPGGTAFRPGPAKSERL